MSLVYDFFNIFWQLINAMAPYILFGLLFAGILHEIVPDSLVTKHLGKDNLTSVIKATIFGIPLPVCSCGVIPLATSIKKSGASNGSVLSFLISTPITGIDSIAATYGIFGWLFTIYRVISSMIIAIFAGIFTNMFDKKSQKTTSVNKPKFSLNTQSTNKATFTLQPKKIENEKFCCDISIKSDKKRFSLASAIRYGFITLLGDIGKPLFWGLVVGTLITMAIPQNLSTILAQNSWLSYLIVIAVAIPMYVCATASLPIAAAFILSGVSVGAAFVFLSAGPATNTVTIGVVKKMLGKKAVVIYLSTIAVGSILFGLGLDYIFDTNNINPKNLVHIDEHFGLVSILSSICLLGFLLYFLTKPYLKK